MANCPGCGAVNDEKTLNCVACGRVLIVTCPQCSTGNSPSAQFCSHCGRVMNSNATTLLGGNNGEPIAEMMLPSIASAGDSPPKAAFLKVVLGAFLFAFLFLSQAFSGYPLAGIIAGFISGLTSLWGLVELTFWILDRTDQPSEQSRKSDIEEAFPSGVDQGFSNIETSFEDLDKEVILKNALSTKSENQGKKTAGENKIAQPDGMVTSMVSGTLDSKADLDTLDLLLPRSEQPPKIENLEILPAAETCREEDMLPISEDSILDLPERDKKSQTLAEFLDDGVSQEIQSVTRKIKKSPANFSLLMKLAQLHEERGEITNALAVMEKCLSHNPQQPEVHLFHGILLRLAGKNQEAKAAFEKVLSLNKFMSKAYYQLGVLERTLRNVNGARDDFQKCIQLAPDDAYAHYQLGMVYREMGDLSLAQMELNRACILNPSDSYGHSQLGQIHHQLKQWDRAVGEYSMALSLKPNDSFILEKLAEVMMEKGEDLRAQDLFYEAISHQLHPETRTLIALAKVLNRLGKYREMRPIIEDVLRISPNHADGLYFMALSYIYEKDFEKGRSVLQQLTDSSPDKWEAWLELGKLLQSSGQEEEALSAFIKASPNAADQAGVWNTIGVLLTNKKDYEEALKAFKKAVSHDYSDPQIQANLKAVQKKIESTCRRVIESAAEALAADPNALCAYLDMGHAYELIDRPEEALMAYQRLLSIKPDSIEGLLAYAELLKHRGKLKMAIRCYREVLKIQQGHVDARLQLVKANLNLGFINEALRHAVVVQKLVPEDARVHFLLGKIYFAKGLAPRALKEFTIVVNTSKDPDMISWAELMRRRLSKNF